MRLTAIHGVSRRQSVFLDEAHELKAIAQTESAPSVLSRGALLVEPRDQRKGRPRPARSGSVASPPARPRQKREASQDLLCAQRERRVAAGEEKVMRHFA